MDVLFQHIPKACCCEVLLPLTVPVLEDRLVQLACARLLSSIFESSDLAETSYGYRPNRSAKEAIEDLQFNLQFGKFGYLVEADIKGFLEPLPYCTPFHERL